MTASDRPGPRTTEEWVEDEKQKKEEEHTYPSWRVALFGNGHVANIKCAIAYVFWHVAFAILAISIAVFDIGVRVRKGVGKLLPKNIGPDPDRVVSAYDRVDTEKNHERAHKAVQYLAMGLIGVLLLVIVYCLYRWPHQTLEAIGLIVVSVTGGIAALGAVVYVTVLLEDYIKAVENIVFGFLVIVLESLFVGVERAGDTTAKKASSTGKFMKEHKVTRRVYGYCPVSIHVKPKWFTKRFEDE